MIGCAAPLPIRTFKTPLASRTAETDGNSMRPSNVELDPASKPESSHDQAQHQPNQLVLRMDQPTARYAGERGIIAQ